MQLAQHNKRTCASCHRRTDTQTQQHRRATWRNMQRQVHGAILATNRLQDTTPINASSHCIMQLTQTYASSDMRCTVRGDAN